MHTMHTMKKTILSVAIIAAAGLSSVANSAQHMSVAIGQIDSNAGKILTDAEGMSLYTFDKDSDGTSVCNGGCAVKWPPLMAQKGAEAMGDFSVIKRADGGYQWAQDGHPLYTWFKDTQSGDTTGDGVKGVWHLARP